ncbi:MAG: hypothetical protein QOD77_745 [Thermoplasmata archaeon]|nr:hypothetical protein [Thermoplasmata archaeon]
MGAEVPRPKALKAWGRLEAMADKGILDAWCPECVEVRKHKLLDPGSCQCTVCGHVEQMTRPLKPGEEVQA